MFDNIRSLLVINFYCQETFLIGSISLCIFTYSGFLFLHYSILLRCTCLEIWPFLLGFHDCWTMTLTITFIDHLYFLGKL